MYKGMEEIIMKIISIDKKLLDVCPNLQLGCINYSVNVEKGNEELWDEINKEISKITNNMTMEDVYKQKNIESSRNLYKLIGKDPHRYRVSSEALIRRIVQGKGLYKINNVVDANNLISIISKLSVGSYDTDKLGENLIFRIGKKGESYKGIGKDIVKSRRSTRLPSAQVSYSTPDACGSHSISLSPRLSPKWTRGRWSPSS